MTAEQAMVIVKRKLGEHYKSVTAAFRKIDRNHNGKVSYRELRSMLRGWNLDLNDAEFMRFVQKIQRGLQGKGGDNDITVQQFCHSVLGKAVAAPSDQTVHSLMPLDANGAKPQPKKVAPVEKKAQPAKPVLRLPSIAKKRRYRQHAIPSSRVPRAVLRKTLLLAQRGELPYINEISKNPKNHKTNGGGNSRYQDIYLNWKSIRRELGKNDNLSPHKIRLVPTKRFYDVVVKKTSLTKPDVVTIAEPFLTSKGKRGPSRSYVDWSRLIKHTLQLFHKN